MRRAMGRVLVSKVDSSGNKIKNFKKWRKDNPKEVYFDSYPEWEVWEYLTKSKIKFTSQPTLLLVNELDVTEFVKPRQTKKAKKEGRNSRDIKKVKQQKISYTPDYYLPKFDIYIEVKGYADEVFKLRWKLFKSKGYEGFIVYSLAEFKLLYKRILELYG